MPSKEFKEIAIEAAKTAGKVLLKYYNKKNKITNKSLNDLLNEADLTSEKVILDILKKNFSEHNIISEERGFIEKKSDYTWIIDPLDGTIFFSKSVPLFSVSIGLNYKKDIKLGVIYVPYLNELFFAEKGKGAFLNGKKIKVSSINKISKATITIDYAPRMDAINRGIDLMKKLANNSFFTRAFACEAIELAYIACGRFDANIDYSGKLWDMAAAKVILEEAGGKITDTNGNSIILNNTSLKKIASNSYNINILASNKKLHKQLLKLIR